MNARDKLNQQKFRDAGEQAGFVFGEFMTIAEDVGRRFETELSAKNRSYKPATNHNSSHHDSGVDSESCQRQSSEPVKTDYKDEDNSGSSNNNHYSDWHNASEFLHQLREHAEDTVDGFARSINRQGAECKARPIGEEQDRFQGEWLHQISDLLKKNDPSDFLDKLSQLYAPETSVNNTDGELENTTVKTDVVADQRKRKLDNIFSDEQLQHLTEKQFEVLLGLVETNYRAALNLIRK